MKKMKKIFCTVIALIMLLSICPLTVFAEGEETPGQVTQESAVPQQEQVVVESTSTQEIVQEPSAELEPPVESEQPVHQHSYLLAAHTDATCTSKGYDLFMCVCGDKYVVEHPCVAHKYSDGKCMVCSALDPDWVDTEVKTEAPVENTEIKTEAVTSVLTATEEKMREPIAEGTENTEEQNSEEDKTEKITAEGIEPRPMTYSEAKEESVEDEPALKTMKFLSVIHKTIEGISYKFDSDKKELTVTGQAGTETLTGKNTEGEKKDTAIEEALKQLDEKPENVFTVIVDNIKKIGQFAFTGLKNLQTVFIGEETETIAQGAFAGTEELDAIIVDPANKNYADEFGTLYSKDKTELVAVPADKDLVFPINPNVKTVDDYAFAHSDAKEIIFTGNAPEFKSANEINKHTFEDTNASIRYPLGNWTWNPNWYNTKYADKPFVDSNDQTKKEPSVRPYLPHYWRHYPVVTKAGVAPTETEFGLTEELRCRVCGKLIQAQTKIWPNGKPDTGIYSFDSINSVPASLQNNEKFNSVQKIKDVLKQETAAEYQNKTSRTMPDMNYKACDVKPITGPASGPYIVTIPYPSGVGPEHYDFVCVHLNSNGNIEKLDVFETNRGMQVTVSDLSPFGYSWYYNDVDP